jgi:RHS repeat-associated protein
VSYQFDNLNRRYQADLADGTKWDYGYNSRSEVTTGRKKLASGAFEGGKQYEYNYDDIGNRTVARFGGDAAGNNLREADYGAANALNQLTTREVPGSIWLTGDAPTNMTLQGAVEGRAFAVQRQEGGRFFGEATVDNAAGPVFARLTVAGKEAGVLTDIDTGHDYVPRNPESFVYDADGNLVSDGRWTNTWDCENRLIAMESLPGVPDVAKKRLEFAYDHQWRRVQKIVFTSSGSQYVPQSTNRFVYDGWNLVAILDAPAYIVRSFTWGQDLSGSIQGAAGVGGLLSMTIHAGPQTGAYLYSYDGNGNVMALVNAGDASLAAHYEYGPFSEVIRATGPVAEWNPYRFSTKYEDDETHSLYYGYRYLSSSAGRWPNRDPIGEEGGLNLYAFAQNSPLHEVDALGERIVSLEIHHSGKAEIPDSDYTGRVTELDEYYDQILPGDLGFRHKLIPKHLAYMPDPWGGIKPVSVTRPARTVVGFKFEYVVRRECVAGDSTKDFKLTHRIADMGIYIRKKGGQWKEYEPNSWKPPGTPDGPSLVKIFDNLKIVAGDMVRYPLEKGDGWEYRVTVAWTVRAEDADNAFEGKHRVNMTFSESGGTGSAFVLTEPKEVPK